MRQANKIYTDPQPKLSCEGEKAGLLTTTTKNVARNGKSLTN